jgi:hypothetical protein
LELGGIGVLVASGILRVACGRRDANMTTNPALHTDAQIASLSRAQVSATR